jgi:RNA polymerase sigma-70 factor (ECF subfamily)
MAERKHADWDRLATLYAPYLEGDGKATDALFREFTRVLHGYFSARLRADPGVDDLVQATLLKLHFSRERFDSARSLKTWVFTIASRSLIDYWRGSTADLDDSEDVLEALPAEGLDPALKTELHGDLNEALKTLKPIDRSIVYLYAVEGLSLAEIAASLGLTEGAAKVRAHRAYRELRGFLGVFALLLFRDWT